MPIGGKGATATLAECNSAQPRVACSMFWWQFWCPPTVPPHHLNRYQISCWLVTEAVACDKPV